MPRQCISKRIKNIEERKKTYNPVTFLQKFSKCLAYSGAVHQAGCWGQKSLLI